MQTHEAIFGYIYCSGTCVQDYCVLFPGLLFSDVNIDRIKLSRDWINSTIVVSKYLMGSNSTTDLDGLLLCGNFADLLISWPVTQ